jgi:hypothetical protein
VTVHSIDTARFTLAAGERVIAVGAPQVVVAGAAREAVRPAAAIDPVVSVAARKGIIARATSVRERRNSIDMFLICSYTHYLAKLRQSGSSSLQRRRGRLIFDIVYTSPNSAAPTDQAAGGEER